MIGSAPSLLGRNEPFAGELVRQAFEDHGVRVELNAKVDRVDRVDPRDTGAGHVHGGEVTVGFSDQRIAVDEVVVAVGRTPSSADIGLASVGVDVEPSRG